MSKPKYVSEGDYQENGMWHCGICRKPLEMLVEVKAIGFSKVVHCLCDCEVVQYQKERDAFKKEQKQIRVDNTRHMAFSDERFKRCTFESDDGSNKPLVTIAKNYVEHFENALEKGKGLLLLGDVGNGKTFAAACIANALIDRGYTCLMTNFETISNVLQSCYEERYRYIEELNNFDLLVIDDLGAERNTEYMQKGVVNTIIDNRYRSCKPMVITTNLNLEDFCNPKDTDSKRIFSRIKEVCFPFECKGEDRREIVMTSEEHKQWRKELKGGQNG